jgi:hypothetical protein
MREVLPPTDTAARGDAGRSTEVVVGRTTTRASQAWVRRYALRSMQNPFLGRIVVAD